MKAVSRASALTVSFALATAAGAQTFGVPQLLSSALPGASAACAGDFDGDGELDLVTCAEFAGTVQFHRGLGAGSFEPEVVVGTLATPVALTCADLDADGDPDLLVACSGPGEIVVFENLGGGAVAAPQTLVSGLALASSVVALDDDGDGDLDVLACGYGDSRILRSENLGGGVFGAPAEAAMGLVGPYQLETLDVGNDGILDLVIADYLLDGVLLCVGSGTGTYQAPAMVGAGDGALSVVAGDIDGDGHEDLAFAAFYGAEVWTARADRLGGFEAPVLVSSLENGAHHVALSDLDQNGELDLVVSAYNQSRVSMYRQAAGTFGARELICNSGSGAVLTLAVDLTGDLAPDVLSVFRNSGEVYWSENLMGGGGPDCNGNGVPDADDIALGTSNDCDADGQPDECQLAADPASDWNGDGLLDSCVGGEARYCYANANSSGQGGRIDVSGTPLVAENSCTLVADQLPQNQFAYFVYSTNTGVLDPFGGGVGVLCLGAPMRRLNDPARSGAVLNSGSTGSVSLTLDLTNLPQPAAVAPGDLLHFQLWFRDVLPGGGPTSNTTDGISVLFR